MDAVLEQINVNKKMIAQNERLEEIVAERTEELSRANKILEEMSLQDPLTGIPNRRYYDNQLEIEWRRARREQNSLALCMIDIDHFKEYNDSYGHAKGDECLSMVAKMVQAQLHRPGDFAARSGGEEFAVILPRTDAAGSEVTVERIRSAIELLKITHKNSSTNSFLTISIGISVYDIDEGSSLEDFKEQADKALYMAKENGRNRFWVWQNYLD